MITRILMFIKLTWTWVLSWRLVLSVSLIRQLLYNIPALRFDFSNIFCVKRWKMWRVTYYELLIAVIIYGFLISKSSLWIFNYLLRVSCYILCSFYCCLQRIVRLLLAIIYSVLKLSFDFRLSLNQVTISKFILLRNFWCVHLRY